MQPIQNVYIDIYSLSMKVSDHLSFLFQKVKMGLRRSSRTTRSSMAEAKKRERNSSRTLSSQKRLSSHHPKKSLAVSPEQVKRTRASSPLPNQEMKGRAGLLRWRKSLRPRTKSQTTSPKLRSLARNQLKVSFKAAMELATPSSMLQECSICAERKGKYVAPSMPPSSC